MEDPMLLEVSFMSQRLEVEGGISIQCTVSCIPLIEEIHSPVLFRSEVEQLVGQELIKALSDFKQLMVAPLSPQAHQLSSSEKDSNVEHLVDTWSISCQRKTKIKGRKPSIRVVRDLLTKKWVFVKRNSLRSAMLRCSNNLPPSSIVTQALVLASCEEGSSRQRKDNTKSVM
jgi:hypothetical protein